MKTAIIAVISFGLAWVVPQLPGRSNQVFQASLDADTVEEYLALTSGQHQKLKALSTKLQGRAQSSMEELESTQKALRMRLASDDNDAMAAGKALLNLEVAKRRAERTSEEIRKEAVALLTTEQITKLKALDQAVKLHPVARQAMGMFLIAPPDSTLTGTGPLGMFPARKRQARPAIASAT